MLPHVRFPTHSPKYHALGKLVGVHFRERARRQRHRAGGEAGSEDRGRAGGGLVAFHHQRNRDQRWVWNSRHEWLQISDLPVFLKSPSSSCVRQSDPLTHFPAAAILPIQPLTQPCRSRGRRPPPWLPEATRAGLELADP